MATPIGTSDPERPLTLLNFPFHSMILMDIIIVLYYVMLIDTCKSNVIVSKICLSIILVSLSVLIGKICSKRRKQHQLFVKILTDFRPISELIATVKNVTYYIYWCFKVSFSLFQKMKKKFQKTWKFSFIGKTVQIVKILTATQKCSSFSRAPQSIKGACAYLKKELLPVWKILCFSQLFFVKLKDILARTKRTKTLKEGKNYAFLENQAIFRFFPGFQPYFCIFMPKVYVSQITSHGHDHVDILSGQTICQISITIK